MCSVDGLIGSLYELTDAETVALWTALSRGYLRAGHTDRSLIEIYLRTCFLGNRDGVIVTQPPSGVTKIIVALSDLNSLKSFIDRFTSVGVSVERVLPHCGIIVSSPLPPARAQAIARSISRTPAPTRGDFGGRNARGKFRVFLHCNGAEDRTCQ